MTAQVPFNVEAEHALLGILLVDPVLLGEVGGLRAIDFYEGLHQLIYAAMQQLAYDGTGVTPAAIAIRLASQGDMQSFGKGFLNDLAERAPASTMLGHYLALIADMSSRRDLIRMADNLKAQAMSGDVSAEALIHGAESLLTQIATGAGVTDHWFDGGDICDSVDDILSGKAVAFEPSGIDAYDREIGGLQHARMNILAARAKMGKTAVAVWLAKRKLDAGKGVGMFSLEMGKGELGMRLACAMAYEHGGHDNPEYFLAAKGELSDAALRKMLHAARHLRGLPLKVDDRPGLRPSQIAPAAKRLIRQWQKRGIEPGIIIVDHLTIMRPDHASGNKVAEVTEVSGALRDLARETEVTFLVLCQLSREVDKRGVTNHRPQLSDLRWSGEIEQDAAQVTFLYRHERYLKEPDGSDLNSADWLDYMDEKQRWANRIELINGANRMGPSGTVELGINLGCNAMWEDAA